MPKIGGLEVGQFDYSQQLVPCKHTLLYSTVYTVLYSTMQHYSAGTPCACHPERAVLYKLVIAHCAMTSCTNLTSLQDCPRVTYQNSFFLLSFPVQDECGARPGALLPQQPQRHAVHGSCPGSRWVRPRTFFHNSLCRMSHYVASCCINKSQVTGHKPEKNNNENLAKPNWFFFFFCKYCCRYVSFRFT